MQYIFTEWLTLLAHADPQATNSVAVAFITQLHNRQILASQEDLLLFLRSAIDTAVHASERTDYLESSADPTEAYFAIDGLARLIVLTVKNRGQADGTLKGDKIHYMKTILSFVVLVLNNHHVMREENFHQRAFFRLFSSILYDWHDLVRGDNLAQDREMVLVFARIFLLLEPFNFPAFVYGWLSLASHRIFMPAILKLTGNEVCEI